MQTRNRTRRAHALKIARKSRRLLKADKAALELSESYETEEEAFSTEKVTRQSPHRAPGPRSPGGRMTRGPNPRTLSKTK